MRSRYSFDFFNHLVAALIFITVSSMSALICWQPRRNAGPPRTSSATPANPCRCSPARGPSPPRSAPGIGLERYLVDRPDDVAVCGGLEISPSPHQLLGRLAALARHPAPWTAPSPPLAALSIDLMKRPSPPIVAATSSWRRPAPGWAAKAPGTPRRPPGSHRLLRGTCFTLANHLPRDSDDSLNQCAMFPISSCDSTGSRTERSHPR